MQPTRTQGITVLLDLCDYRVLFVSKSIEEAYFWMLVAIANTDGNNTIACKKVIVKRRSKDQEMSVVRRFEEWVYQH